MVLINREDTSYRLGLPQLTRWWLEEQGPEKGELFIEYPIYLYGNTSWILGQFLNYKKNREKLWKFLEATASGKLRASKESGISQYREDTSLLAQPECTDCSGHPVLSIGTRQGHATWSKNHDIRIRAMH